MLTTLSKTFMDIDWAPMDGCRLRLAGQLIPSRQAGEVSGVRLSRGCFFAPDAATRFCGGPYRDLSLCTPAHRFLCRAEVLLHAMVPRNRTEGSESVGAHRPGLIDCTGGFPDLSLQGRA
jgi:hypothetical protein